MAYLLIRQPDSKFVDDTLNRLIERQGERPFLALGVREYFRKTTETVCIAEVSYKNLRNMSPAERAGILKGANAYEITKFRVDLRKPAFVGDGAEYDAP